jgi:hypothetical protein
MPTYELKRVEPFVIAKAHLPEVSGGAARSSDWLVSRSEEMVLIGREAGKAVFAHVEQRMETLPALSVLPVDFRNVRFLDVSFADELIVRLCRRIASGEFEGRFFLLTEVNPEIAENLQVYLEDRKQACLCEVTGSGAAILGDISQELRETYEYAVQSGSITARELISNRCPDLSINASSNRLSRLHRMGLLAFVQSESVEAGGRQNVYIPVR